MHWDMLNYHFYYPYALLNNRLEQDFYPANILGYFNPIAYLPFYWVASSGVHSVFVVITLALIHSLNLILLYGISLHILARTKANSPTHAIIATIIGGCLCPLFLVEMGSTYIDNVTSIPIFIGLYLYVRRLQTSDTNSYRQALIIGICMGAATALKLTNIIFIVAAGVLFLSQLTKDLKKTLRLECAYGLGTILGFALFGAYWHLKLYTVFGNPFFPLFNHIFHSPYFVNEAINLQRFTPLSIYDALIAPLRIAEPLRWSYVELLVPDIRLLAFFLILFFTLLIKLSKNNIFSIFKQIAWSPFTSLLAFFLVGWSLWLATTGNGRYGLPLFLLIGPLIIYLVHNYFSKKIIYYTISILVSLQLFLFIKNSDFRWDTQPWTSKWLPITIPNELKERPALFINLQGPSMGFLAAFTHPASAFVNSMQEYQLHQTAQTREKLAQLIERYSDQMWLLINTEYRINGPEETKHIYEDVKKQYDIWLSPFNLRVANWNCLFFSLKELYPTKFSHTLNNITLLNHDYGEYLLGACPIEKIHTTNDTDNQIKTALNNAQVDQAFNNVEKQCPKLFGLGNPTSIRNSLFGQLSFPSRFYYNSEIWLKEEFGEIQAVSSIWPVQNKPLGKLSDWAKAPQAINCEEIKNLRRNVLSLFAPQTFSFKDFANKASESIQITEPIKN